jgi:hypothetical protein
MAMIALMMEAARTSETLVNFYQTARRCNPEYNHLRTDFLTVCCSAVRNRVVDLLRLMVDRRHIPQRHLLVILSVVQHVVFAIPEPEILRAGG